MVRRTTAPNKLAAKKSAAKKVAAKKVAAKTIRARKIAPKQLAAHAALLLDRLLARYPDAHCALDFSNAFELLCATILSAQCTDKRVNMVTPALFARYPDAPAARRRAARRTSRRSSRARASSAARRRASSAWRPRSSSATAARCPPTWTSLVVLPGVGRKTANVILGNAFGRNDGIVVDTHVTRLSNRLGLATEPMP